MHSKSFSARGTAPQSHSKSLSGFTLIELLIVMVIMMALVAVTVPSIRSLLNRGRMVGAAQEVAGVLRVARFEAIKRGVTTVVQVNYANDSMLAFADLNDAAGLPNSDLLYNPPLAAQTSTLAVKNYDYIITSYSLPNQVHFWGAADNSPHGTAAVNGFTASPVVGQPNIAVFNPDGSVRALGALRVGSGTFPRSLAANQDNVDNFLSVNVAPLATARISVTKYNPFVTLDPTQYYEQGMIPGTLNPLWVWY